MNWREKKIMIILRVNTTVPDNAIFTVIKSVRNKIKPM